MHCSIWDCSDTDLRIGASCLLPNSGCHAFLGSAFLNGKITSVARNQEGIENRILSPSQFLHVCRFQSDCRAVYPADVDIVKKSPYLAAAFDSLWDAGSQNKPFNHLIITSIFNHEKSNAFFQKSFNLRGVSGYRGQHKPLRRAQSGIPSL